MPRASLRIRLKCFISSNPPKSSSREKKRLATFSACKTFGQTAKAYLGTRRRIMSLSFCKGKIRSQSYIAKALAGRLLYHENKWLAWVLIKFLPLEYQMSCVKYALSVAVCCLSSFEVLSLFLFFARSGVFYKNRDFHV